MSLCSMQSSKEVLEEVEEVFFFLILLSSLYSVRQKCKLKLRNDLDYQHPLLTTEQEYYRITTQKIKLSLDLILISWFMIIATHTWNINILQHCSNFKSEADPQHKKHHIALHYIHTTCRKSSSVVNTNWIHTKKVYMMISQFSTLQCTSCFSTDSLTHCKIISSEYFFFLCDGYEDTLTSFQGSMQIYTKILFTFR